MIVVISLIEKRVTLETFSAASLSYFDLSWLVQRVYILLYPQQYFTTRPTVSASPMTIAATQKPVSMDPALILASATVDRQFDVGLKHTGLFVAATNTITLVQTPPQLCKLSIIRHQKSTR